MAPYMSIAFSDSTALQEKLASIIIPSIEFRQADAIDVLQFLIDASTGDQEAGSTPSIGLTITNKPTTTSQYYYELDDGTRIDLPPLTIQYNRISLLDAIDRVTTELGLKYLFENEQIVFQTKDGKTIYKKKIVEHVPPEGRGEAPRP